MLNQSPRFIGVNLSKIMCLGKHIICNLEKYNDDRVKCIENKPNATFITFSELCDIINTIDNYDIL